MNYAIDTYKHGKWLFCHSPTYSHVTMRRLKSNHISSRHKVKCSMNYTSDADKYKKWLFCHYPTFSPITLQWRIQTLLYLQGTKSSALWTTLLMLMSMNNDYFVIFWYFLLLPCNGKFKPLIFHAKGKQAINYGTDVNKHEKILICHSPTFSLATLGWLNSNLISSRQ